MLRHRTTGNVAWSRAEESPVPGSGLELDNTQADSRSDITWHTLSIEAYSYRALQSMSRTGERRCYASNGYNRSFPCMEATYTYAIKNHFVPKTR